MYPRAPQHCGPHDVSGLRLSSNLGDVREVVVDSSPVQTVSLSTSFVVHAQGWFTVENLGNGVIADGSNRICVSNKS